MPMASVSVLHSRPPHPDFAQAWPSPPKGIIRSVRRGIRASLYTAFERGWLGLRPLRTHVVIFGFTRSGSTLLQMQIETCVSNARTFGTEMSAAWVQYLLTNQTFLITKAPWDVFYLDEIRALYAARRADVRFILTVRDPRAILTSIHARLTGGPDGYFLDPAHWITYYDHVRYAQQFDDVVTVEYEDMVCHPGEVQRRLTEFIGWHVHLPFDQFHTAVASDFEQVNLNGLRPLDPTRLDAWRQEQHRARIQLILQELPELPEYLIEMGYESDTSWVRDYL
jgi:Sulfotransferase family